MGGCCASQSGDATVGEDMEQRDRRETKNKQLSRSTGPPASFAQPSLPNNTGQQRRGSKSRKGGAREASSSINSMTSLDHDDGQSMQTDVTRDESQDQIQRQGSLLMSFKKSMTIVIPMDEPGSEYNPDFKTPDHTSKSRDGGEALKVSQLDDGDEVLQTMDSGSEVQVQSPQQQHRQEQRGQQSPLSNSASEESYSGSSSSSEVQRATPSASDISTSQVMRVGADSTSQVTDDSNIIRIDDLGNDQMTPPKFGSQIKDSHPMSSQNKHQSSLVSAQKRRPGDSPAAHIKQTNLHL